MTGLSQKGGMNQKSDTDHADSIALLAVCKVMHSQGFAQYLFCICDPISSCFPGQSILLDVTAVICIFMCSHHCFRCTQLFSHVPDVKMLGWQRQNTEGHHNYCLCSKRRGFVGPLALHTQPSPELMAHWVPSYHSAPLSCLWWNPHLLAHPSQP